ncbi:unnamed protein product [Kuraishia capsulata CBS 1993]|uniref:Suppressor of forked domain-containing protein n=1 Tax=Kuraishia capsulata CBS 1993 TaxID=1382522 RepID=W6MKP9_9ASCO|nr:uncharacterized protein KUCA_T00002953001 [Kuraishia capsulata CBS 1993]CDK26976.1 unnamed protein product [Kuraishia capsulata CBS 1993]
MTMEPPLETVSPQWRELLAAVTEDPSDFAKWEKLIELAEGLGNGIQLSSSQKDKQLLRSTYENFLVQFPLCEQYWINFAEWCFRLKLTGDATDVYERALKIMPGSVLLWTSYVRFLKLTDLDIDDLRAQFEKARLAIGFHFHSHEFYDEYLQFLKENDMTREYHYLLRVLIEIPLYHYSKYFEEYTRLIETSDMRTIKYIISSEDLAAQNLTWPDINRDTKRFKELRVVLRKRFIDVYITTQFNVYQLWQFEKRLSSFFFTPVELKRSEIDAWDAYLEYLENTNLKKGHTKDAVISRINDSIIEVAYERCLIVTALYPQFWVKYSDYHLNHNRIDKAIDVLKRGTYLNPITNLKMRSRLIDLEVLNNHPEAAKEIAVEWVSLLPNSIEVFLKLLSVESITFDEKKSGSKSNAERDQYLLDLVQFKLDEVKSSGESAFDVLFSELLDFPISFQSLVVFFERHAASKKSEHFWRAFYTLFNKYGESKAGDKHRLQKQAKLKEIEEKAVAVLSEADFRKFQRHVGYDDDDFV